MEKRNLETYELAEKRLITIVDDRELQTAVIREREPETLPQKIRHYTQKMFFGGMIGQVETIIKAIETFQSYLDKKGQKVLPIAISEAKQFVFPPGHPSIGSVYGMHPTNTKMYYPVIDFHRLNFESKYAEAIRLLARLGANKIAIKHVQGWKLDFSLSAEVNSTEVEVGVEGGKAQTSDSSIFTVIEYDGHDNPQLPADLYWYPYEPIWIAVAESRINDNLRNFKIMVSYNDDYGINGSLNANILKAGLKSSGKFTEQVNTTWTIEGTFGKKAE